MRYRLGIARDSERRRYPNRRPLEEHGSIGYRRPQPFGELGRSHYRRLRQKDSHLLAAEAGTDVDRAHAVPEDFTEVSEHGVAGFVAIRVVDDLEVIDVDEDQRRRAAEAIGLREHATELLVEVPAVRQPGERVRARAKRDLLDLPDFLEKCPSDAREQSDVPCLLDANAPRLRPLDDDRTDHALLADHGNHDE